MFPLIFKGNMLKFNDSSAALAGNVCFYVFMFLENEPVDMALVHPKGKYWSFFSTNLSGCHLDI
jgi:hypothetical protein